MQNEITKKARRIKLIAMDVDGVLTDGRITFSDSGEEFKTFNFKDIMGCSLARKNAYKIALITGENSKILTYLSNKLNADSFYTGIKDKLAVIENLKQKYNLTYGEIAYIGDDINDIKCIEKVGFGVAVSNAVDEAKEVADYITTLEGGKGAVREVINLILSSHEK